MSAPEEANDPLISPELLAEHCGCSISVATKFQTDYQFKTSQLAEAVEELRQYIDFQPAPGEMDQPAAGEMYYIWK